MYSVLILSLNPLLVTVGGLTKHLPQPSQWQTEKSFNNSPVDTIVCLVRHLVPHLHLVLWTERHTVFHCESQSWYSKQTCETTARASEVSNTTSTAVLPAVLQALFSGPLETV